MALSALVLRTADIQGKKLVSLYLISGLFLLAQVILATKLTVNIDQYYLDLACYGMSAASVFLTCWFTRSRSFFLAITLVGMHLGLSFYPDKLHLLLSVFVPLNLLYFPFLEERGIFSSWGRRLIVLLGVQFVCAYLFATWQDDTILTYISGKVVPLFAQSRLSNLAVLLFCLSFLRIVTSRSRGNSNFKIAVIFAIISVFAALFFKNGKSIPVFLAGAHAALIFSAVLDHYYMAYMDELTQIPSRRALKEDLMKLGGKYCICMLDIDHFKKFNDTYGHDAGDDVLRMVAKIIQKISRSGGKAYRYGGEEFTILFPDKDISTVFVAVDSMREHLAFQPFKLRRNSEEVNVTISIGIAEPHSKIETPEEVIKRADEALYNAKRNGRNRVCK